MSQTGKSHLVIMFTVGLMTWSRSRIFASHGEFMKGIPRGRPGAAGLQRLQGPGAVQPEWTRTLSPTGNTTFVVDEYYESPAASPGIGRTRRRLAGDVSAAPAWSRRRRS